MDLARLNALPGEDAIDLFLDCCASTTWAEQMAARRAFADIGELLEEARRVWRDLDAADRSEAFAAHPRIGDRVTGDDRHAAWSRNEQEGADAADDEVRERLVACNRAYEERFGRVFLVFASGKSASEMLALCEGRLGNDPETEYEIASAEQEKIADLRLRRLLEIG